MHIVAIVHGTSIRLKRMRQFYFVFVDSPDGRLTAVFADSPDGRSSVGACYPDSVEEEIWVGVSPVHEYLFIDDRTPTDDEVIPIPLHPERPELVAVEQIRSGREELRSWIARFSDQGPSVAMDTEANVDRERLDPVLF